jgi:hypothetical protein
VKRSLDACGRTTRCDFAKILGWRADNQQPLKIHFDGTPLSSITPLGTSHALYNTATLKVTAGRHMIALTGLTPRGGDNTP